MRQRDIFLFALPLIASWLLMMTEGPIMSAAVNRLPEEVVMLAALGIVFTLAVTLESPIMSLLNTATALVRDRESYRVMRRYTLVWSAVLTVLSALLAWSPLFDWMVIDLMGTPAPVARWVRPGLGIMVPWTALIAWRRFLQGLLVYRGQTRKVAESTAVRLVFSAGTAVALLVWGGWPGIYVGAAGLMAGVVGEAIYTTWITRAVVREPVEGGEAPGQAPVEPLKMAALARFQMPLALTSLMVLLTQPMVAAALARLDRPTQTLAAWPLILQFVLILRSPAFALPGAIIALAERPGAKPALDRFSLTLTAVVFVATAALSLTPIADLYLSAVQNAAPAVGALARHGFVLLLPLPALTVLLLWRRGWLIARKATLEINLAMFVRVAAVAGLLVLGVKLRWPGLVTAAVALNVGNFAEFLFLLGRSRGAC